jgi:pimeloyl-ACP methyl ester carboxylesterase
MTWEKPSQKSYKIKCSRIAAAHGVGLAGLFSIIILILLIAPIASMGAPPQPPGRLVDDVSGSVGINMHIYCIGEGSPTIVLDAGLGAGSMSWARVQEEVSNHTRVCSYDRAGMGWSEPGPKPRTYMKIADELYALLQAAGEQGPYVLVGHSAGAHTVRFFVQKHPADVAGIVLVDPAHEKILTKEVITAIQQLQMSYVGYVHLGFWQYVLNPDVIKRFEGPNVPAEVINNSEVVFSPKSIYTAADELAALYETVLALNATNIEGAWDNKPTIVLSADNEIAQLTGALGLHKELVSLSTRGEQILVPGGHNIHYEHPEVVAEAILNIVNAVRQGI